jgi:hypothetical protein
MQVMLPIVRQGINSHHAETNGVVHSAMNLTGYSLKNLSASRNLSPI